MHAILSFVVGMLTAALSFAGSVQKHIDLPQTSHGEMQQVTAFNAFIDAGCTHPQVWPENQVDCSAAPFASKLSCSPGSSPSGVFGVPTIDCDTTVASDLSGSDDRYFSCGPIRPFGAMWSCRSLLVYDKGEFTEVKGMRALIARFGKIRTPEQAKWLVLATQRRVRPSVDLGKDVFQAPEVPSSRNGDAFDVVVYLVSGSDCNRGTLYPIYSITFTVTPSGVVTEKSRTVVYHYLAGGSCE